MRMSFNRSCLWVALWLAGAMVLQGSEACAQSAPPPKASKPATLPVSLEKEPGLDAALSGPFADLAGIATQMNAATQKGFIVLGDVTVTEPTLKALENKPVREAMAALAKAAESSWERHGSFYLLLRKGIPRHGSKP